MPALPDELIPGDEVLFADGTVGMRVEAASLGVATLTVTLPGYLRSGQGINLPGANLKVAALTDADCLDLDWASQNLVDYIGLSFARTAEDERRSASRNGVARHRCAIVAKIEKPQAVENSTRFSRRPTL